MKIVSDLSLSARQHRPRSGLPQPVLRLDFTTGAYHPGGFGSGLTFARAGAARYHDAAGVMQVAAADQPRFDRHPVTGAVRGLLIEGARSNLLTYSEDFTNVVWAKSNTTVVANQLAAPDGQVSADKLVPSAGLSQHRVEYTTTLTAGQVCTFSVYAKAAGYGSIWLRIGTTGSSIVSLSNGAVSPTATQTVVSDMGNGWWRVAITAAASGNDILRINALTGTTAADFAGDGSSGILVWGAQLEVGEAASSYIPTTTASVTRAADSLQVALAGWWPGPAQGSLLAEFSAPAVSQEAVVVAFNTTGAANSIALIKANADTSAAGTYLTGMMSDGSVSTSGLDAGLTGGPHRMVMGWGAGGMIAAINGALGPSAVQRLGVPTKLWIGGRDGGQVPLNGHIRRVVWYAQRLSNAQLTALTL